MRTALLTIIFAAHRWGQASSGSLIGDVFIEVRGEVFNSLNHPGPFYGNAFSAGNPRRPQFALRYDF